MKFVTPETYFVGCTGINFNGLRQYLADTDQQEFADEIEDALNEGLSESEIMASMFAKLCYSSLVPGRNENISSVRPIRQNLEACLAHGHGSVFEHASFSFITRNCSRVMTHELVRHRAGTAFSQQSGRYVMTDFDFVMDPILEPVKDFAERILRDHENDVNQLRDRLFHHYRQVNGLAGHEDLPMDLKKKLTSAVRRFRPEGRNNEIAWTMNFRAARHMIQVRTSLHAEWEIRVVFSQAYRLLNKLCPMMFSDARVEELEDGTVFVHAMTMQPYDQH